MSWRSEERNPLQRESQHTCEREESRERQEDVRIAIASFPSNPESRVTRISADKKLWGSYNATQKTVKIRAPQYYFFRLFVSRAEKILLGYGINERK